MEVDQGRQRSQQGTRLAAVHLEAGADEGEVSTPVVDDQIAGAGATKHVLRVGRLKPEIAGEREGAPARQDDTIARRKPNRRRYAVHRQPATPGRHRMTFDGARSIVEPDRPRAPGVKAGGQIALWFEDGEDFRQGIHRSSGRWRRNERRSTIVRAVTPDYLRGQST